MTGLVDWQNIHSYFLGFGISVKPAEVERQYDRGLEPSTSKKCDVVIKDGNVYTKFLRMVNTKVCIYNCNRLFSFSRRGFNNENPVSYYSGHSM